MRAFVAVDLPEHVVDDLAALQEALPVGRAADPETFHLTLAFLGEIADSAAEEAHLELSRLDAPAFALRLSGVEAFGAEPRILAAGVAATPELSGLQRKVATAVRRAGIDLPRRRFRPHVTLVRLKGRLAPWQRERLRAALAGIGGFATAPFTVRSFTLYRSVLSPDGPRHEPLADYPLG
jgi:2'-5' RNA ligase